ncbi:ABC transporter permease [Prolixibacteraceae bacterium Z1-6]|uniref:ABC transporter permease n=1 Tax=Draconibacterium aestuarii TaxID=2998507 RepID=A0A9X3J6T7_9BACT|nr:ABC transporter permease [Prolixibacteraceae bacterium Z1-6]
MKGMTNHPMFLVLLREIERIKLNPAYRFLLFGGPLIGILLLFFIFHQGTTQKLPIAVVDQSNSTLSIKISNALNASADVAVVEMACDMFEAKKMLEQAVVDAIVLLPKELEKNVFMGTEAPVLVYINGTNVLKSGLIQSSVLTTIKTISGGVQLKKLLLEGKNSEQAMARIMPVDIQKHVLFNPYTNYGYFLNSAMVYVMLYLFVFLAAIYSFGNELKRGTGMALLETSNNSVRLAVAGKIIPYTILFSGFAVLINYLLYEVEGMPLNGNYLVIFLGQFVTIITYQAMGVMIVAVTKNLRLALSVGSAYSMMGITFSGLTFPLEGMPAVARGFASLFPFTWWEKIMISQSLRGAPVGEALVYMCYIFIFMLVSFASFSLYKRCLRDPKQWGKS